MEGSRGEGSHGEVPWRGVPWRGPMEGSHGGGGHGGVPWRGSHEGAPWRGRLTCPKSRSYAASTAASCNRGPVGCVREGCSCVGEGSHEVCEVVEGASCGGHLHPAARPTEDRHKGRGARTRALRSHVKLRSLLRGRRRVGARAGRRGRRVDERQEECLQLAARLVAHGGAARVPGSAVAHSAASIRLCSFSSGTPFSSDGVRAGGSCARAQGPSGGERRA